LKIRKTFVRDSINASIFQTDNVKTIRKLYYITEVECYSMTFTFNTKHLFFQEWNSSNLESTLLPPTSWTRVKTSTSIHDHPHTIYPTFNNHNNNFTKKLQITQIRLLNNVLNVFIRLYSSWIYNKNLSANPPFK
jgi:hypothetical protein